MELAELISSSEVIFSNNEIETSIGEMAEKLNKTYRDQHVLVLPVLSGAIPFAGHLIPKLTFEVTINYFHLYLPWYMANKIS
jgi:hypoxanthine phosphoribosyltransferase